jgi:hypothetical protein
LDALAVQSRRPHCSLDRISPDVEALICEMRRHHHWGARRIAHELKLEIGEHARHDLPRFGAQRSCGKLDIVGGVFLVDGREHRMLTATDDHSRFVVAATVLPVPSCGV